MVSQNIVDYLYNHDQVSAAWLFGSVAQGRERQDSDIDIAILFVPGLTGSDQFNLRLALAVDLTAIAGREVDIADMISATPFFQHQVRKTGKLLLEKDHQYRVAFDVESRRTYFDLASMLEYRNRCLFQRATKADSHD